MFNGLSSLQTISLICEICDHVNILAVWDVHVGTFVGTWPTVATATWGTGNRHTSWLCMMYRVNLLTKPISDFIYEENEDLPQKVLPTESHIWGSQSYLRIN